MDAFTVKNATQFLDTGSIRGRDSVGIEGPKSSGNAAEIGKSFAETLSDAIGNVNEMQKTADKAAQNLATGRTDNVADVMIAADKADIALKVMVQVRNKIIDAYSEIMKMQV